jgi:hypothetical protein
LQLSQLRHQSNLDSEEYSARLHGFLGISSFFIHFFRIRFNSGDDAVQPGNFTELITSLQVSFT